VSHCGCASCASDPWESRRPARSSRNSTRYSAPPEASPAPGVLLSRQSAVTPAPLPDACGDVVSAVAAVGDTLRARVEGGDDPGAVERADQAGLSALRRVTGQLATPTLPTSMYVGQLRALTLDLLRVVEGNDPRLLAAAGGCWRLLAAIDEALGLPSV
jgi:hypothetical protein